MITARATVALWLAASAYAFPALGQAPDYVIVLPDSAPLRVAPSADAEARTYAPATLQLQVLEVAPDSSWYWVKIGEDKGYELSHSERHWVLRSDVISAASSMASMTLDVSLLEVPEGHFDRRLTESEFFAAGGELPAPFYVSAAQDIRSFQPTCSTALSSCARVYLPGRYFLVLGDRAGKEPLYERLHGDGSVTVRYTLSARQPIQWVRERLILARVMVDAAGCYPQEYRGTEVTTLLDTLRSVPAGIATSHHKLDVNRLVSGTAAGEVQHVRLMYLLELSHAHGARETIARRVLLSWPKCA